MRMTNKKLASLAQDAGFVVASLGEIVVAAPGCDAAKALKAFAKLVLAPELEARKALSRELKEVVDWTLLEKAPLREQELASIRAVLDKHGA
jgi:hypothetical protein